MSSRTTQDLRETLFDCLEQVKAGTMEPKVADQIVKISREIVNTARLELDHSQILSKLDKDDMGVATGPVLLTSDSMESES